MRKTESQWPVHQINWQKSRYVYDMYYTYHRISREVYDYCIKQKIVDAALIAKWKKPGYERLCSTYVINPRNYKFGTVSICRVPKHCLAEGSNIEDPTTGCRGCASGPGGCRNIFGNKYGQYLAAIQIAREEKQAALEAEENEEGENEEDDVEEEAFDIEGNAKKRAALWASTEEETAVDLPLEFLGTEDASAELEARGALRHVGSDTRAAKKQRHE